MSQAAMIRPALMEMSDERVAVADLLIDWLIDESTDLRNSKVVTLGWMTAGVKQIDEGLPTVIALAMGDATGGEDLERVITYDYCLQWLLHYGHAVLERRMDEAEELRGLEPEAWLGLMQLHMELRQSLA